MNNLNPTTNQRQWEHKAHTTHDKDKHNKAQKTKEMSNQNPTTNQRQWEHKAHKTQDKDKHNKAKKTKEMSNLNPNNKSETIGTQGTHNTRQRQTQQSKEN